MTSRRTVRIHYSHFDEKLTETLGLQRAVLFEIIGMRKEANFTGFGTHSRPFIMNSRCVFRDLSLNFSNILAVDNSGVMHHNVKRYSV